MQVLKFGGSSVANSENISKVVTLVLDAIKKDRTILVVSALGGITDMLIQAATSAATGDESYKDRLRQIEHRHLETVKSLLPITGQSAILSAVKTRCNEIEDICSGVFLLGELSARTQDKIVSYGELLSSLIVSARFDALGTKHEWKDSRQLIRTDSHFGHAAVDFNKTNSLIRDAIAVSPANLFIFPGFIASNDQGITTTLGRGGSDYSAAILAAAVDAQVLEIWTDVSGMMTADPRLVSSPKLIPHISYQEAMELSHFGAKVIYPPTIQPVMRKAIPVWIKNTFSPADTGTVIEVETQRNGSSIRGISSIPRIALLSLEGSGMVGIPGFSKRLFEALSGQQVNVILITQGSSEHSICVGIDDANAAIAKSAVDQAFEHEIGIGTVEPLVVERDLSIIALVGDRMKSHPGVSGKLFGALGRNGVNVRAIAQGSSERNISAVIAAGDVRKAINVLHEEFFETTYKQLNLFITGTGNVGRRLLDQLLQQQAWLLQQLRIQLHVVGLANSRKMVFRDEGIDLRQWKQQLENGQPMQLDRWVDGITSRNLRNAVFVDVTANSDVALQYRTLLQKSISVVACNKIACSSAYGSYRQLKDLAREYNARFLFETNVGA
ncbi:MAG TPA: bifunctional aspartate kinase/homoserine dehydrogenase I, partial [Puia sp.]|nr:bifunctional aspartate kinase/homoserine dehydrogenase I [Puia sp.]